jgi:hypothetical protein
MYHILTNKVENDRRDAILDGRSDYLDRIETSFDQGLPLPSEDIILPILFEIDEFAIRGNMTDHLNVTDIPGPVFSLNSKIFLEKQSIVNIEYYQLTLLDEFVGVQIGTPTKPQIELKTIEYTDYFIANVVGLVDCIDHQESILQYFYPPELRNQEKKEDGQEDINDPFAGENPNDIDFITKLVLDESKIDPVLKVFRLKDQPNLLVFHESIVEQIRKEKLSGFVFVPVEKYTDAIPDDDDDEKVEQETTELEQKKAVVQPKQAPEPIAPKPIEESTEPKKRRFFFE